MEDNSKKIGYIAPSATIDIQVSGAFFDRLNFLLFNELRRYSKDETKIILQRLKDKQSARTPDEDIVYVLIALVETIKSAAVTQNKIEYKDPAMAIEEIEELMSKLPKSTSRVNSGGSSQESPPAAQSPQ